MKGFELKIIINTVLVLITILSGVWLSRLGRPLNTPVFTVHKIIAILLIILTAVIIYQLQKNIDLRNIELILIMVSGLMFILAFVTGGLLSFDKPVNEILEIIHKITPLFLIVSTGLTIYVLAKGR